MESLNLRVMTSDRGAVEARSTSDAVRPEGSGERFSEALERRRQERRELCAERHERLRSERGAEAARARELEQSSETTRGEEATDERARNDEPVRERARPQQRSQADAREGSSRASASSSDAASGAATQAPSDGAPSLAAKVELEAVLEVVAKSAAPTSAAATSNPLALPASPTSAAQLGLELGADLGLELASGDLALEGEAVATSAIAASEPESAAPLAGKAGSKEGASAPLGRSDAPQGALEAALESSPAAQAQPKEAAERSDRAAAMLRQIRVHLHPGLREALIQLEPRELGRISIKVALRGEAAHAQLRVSKRSALEALERSLPELRAALERAGLGGGDVSLQLDLSADQGREETSFGSGFGRSRPAVAPLPRGLDSVLQRHVPTSDGVDTYA